MASGGLSSRVRAGRDDPAQLTERWCAHQPQAAEGSEGSVVARIVEVPIRLESLPQGGGGVSSGAVQAALIRSMNAASGTPCLAT